ncbi:cytochrome c [Vibrio sp. SCSIO 43133]|nr:cytochrome c [Vibrio sp. SCSIO 43133]
MALFIGSFTFVSAAKPPIDGNVAIGKQKYEALCISCHGSKGHGDGVAANALPNEPADIAQKINKPFKTPTQIANKVLAGKIDEGMPAFKGVLTEKDAIDILAYVQSIQ